MPIIRQALLIDEYDLENRKCDDSLTGASFELSYTQTNLRTIYSV